MNKKLKSIIREETRTEKQIEALQEHLKEVRIRRKQIEDDAILRSIRGMKLDRGSLLELLDGIQAGSIDMMALITDEAEDEETGEDKDPEDESDSNDDSEETESDPNDDEDADYRDLSDALNEAFEKASQYGAAEADEEGSDDYEE